MAAAATVQQQPNQSTATEQVVADMIRDAMQSGSKLDPVIAGAVADGLRLTAMSRGQFANIMNQSVANEMFLRGHGVAKTISLAPEQLKGIFPYPGGNNQLISPSFNINQPQNQPQPAAPATQSEPAAPVSPATTQLAQSGIGKWLWPLLAVLGLTGSGAGLGYVLRPNAPQAPAPITITQPAGDFSGGVGLEIEG